jgi:hypothetical protein
LWGITARFPASQLPDLDLFRKDSRNGSLGVALAYDSRDNIFTPNRGVSASIEGKRYDRLFLGDYEYWEATLSGAAYLDLGSHGVLGLRGKGSGLGDGAPFWSLASVKMRGGPQDGTWARQRLKERWICAGTSTGDGAWWVSEDWAGRATPCEGKGSPEGWGPVVLASGTCWLGHSACVR